jgi:hypothetical protein
LMQSRLGRSWVLALSSKLTNLSNNRYTRSDRHAQRVMDNGINIISSRVFENPSR